MVVTDFLLEILSEEIPARMQEKASADLARLFEAELAKAGIKASAIESFVTPRRLALIARGLPAATEAVSEELKGPRADAPAQALAGFLGKTGLTREQLVERADAKGNAVLFAVIEKPGRPTSAVLAEAIPAIVKGFPWPKSMRWGTASISTESPRWVRPLQGIVALFGEEIVPFEIAGIASGAATVGHRFHHPGAITIGSASDYAEKLRACHVIVDPAERRGIIEGGARALAEARGLTVIPDAGLVAENAGLTEWPVPLLGDFDPAFLEVPREVIQLTLRTNQKYFVLADAEGKLAPNFICTANIVAEDGGTAIVAGNRKVLAARLSDARFFWEQDLKIPLAEQARKLAGIVFHEKLGTVAEKVDRIAKLARWLAEENIVFGADPVQAEKAARLAKADLVTGMVGEFPELQGVMGGYYASAEGLSAAVADAIRDHYRPVGQGDDVPTAPVTVVVSLADKLDSLAAFFAINEKPTGSKDPFALRRATLGVLQLILTNRLRFSLETVFGEAYVGLLEQHVEHLKSYADRGAQRSEVPEIKYPRGDSEVDEYLRSLLDFFADRLKVQQREAGIRHDLIDAVFALGGEDDLVRLLARVTALQAFVGAEDGANLLAGYKRAANILKKEGEEGSAACAPYQQEAAEVALHAALDAAEPQAKTAVAAEDFEGAMAALAGLRGPIDAFFEQVTVNDADPAKRGARLALLARIRAACHTVADFSKIEG
jgi:glycyl-tRNA synthetase beta chain